MVRVDSKSVFVIGFLLGAVSWGICPVVSDKFEPFDTGTGFVIGQLLMMVFASYVGWSNSNKNVMLSVVGMYVGQNAYVFEFGASGVKTWTPLLLVTSIFLCLLPLIAGLGARRINALLLRKTD